MGCEPSRKQSNKVYFVLGGPGAGKGTQCAMLAAHHNFVHLSAGDLLRAEKSSGSKNAELILKYIEEGKIVPVEITVGLIKTAMEEAGKKGKHSFLIDGFPRNADNEKGWDKVVGKSASVEGVLFFHCKDDKVLVDRIIERGKTSGRADDNKEAIQKRLKTYYDSTKPVIDSFAEKKLVLEIDASLAKEEVYAKVKESMKLPGAGLTFDEEKAVLAFWEAKGGKDKFELPTEAVAVGKLEAFGKEAGSESVSLKALVEYVEKQPKEDRADLLASE